MGNWIRGLEDFLTNVIVKHGGVCLEAGACLYSAPMSWAEATIDGGDAVRGVDDRVVGGGHDRSAIAESHLRAHIVNQNAERTDQVKREGTCKCPKSCHNSKRKQAARQVENFHM